VQEVDLVFDTVGGAAAVGALATAKRGGRFIRIAAPSSTTAAEAAGVQAWFFQMQFSAELLSRIAGMIDANELRPSIGAIFPLSQADKAHAFSERRHGRGRIILQVA
jgi:NADPH:quinone reductase-like Zn-dependent oxidoreductase